MRILYVLGAGASAALAGTPLGANLVWTYFQDCGPQADASRYKKFLDYIGKRFPEFLCEPLKFNKAPSEGLMYFAPEERLRKCHYIDEILRSVQEEGDHETGTLLRELILKHIVSTGNKNLAGYERLKQECLARRGDISILSLNYDTFLNERRPGPTFDYRMSFDWQHRHRINYSRGKDITLLKLNGSLDWAECSSGHLGLLHYVVRDSTFSGGRCGFQDCRGRIEPLIWTAHTSYSSRLTPLWNHAGELLEEAQKVIVIGYSFPDYDKRMIELFRDRLREDAHLEIIDMKTVDESVETARNRIRGRYQQLFPAHSQSQFIAHTSGISEYLLGHRVEREWNHS